MVAVEPVARRVPDTRVLSTETGTIRNYGENPFGSYTPLSGYYPAGQPPVDAPGRTLTGHRHPSRAHQRLC